MVMYLLHSVGGILRNEGDQNMPRKGTISEINVGPVKGKFSGVAAIVAILVFGYAVSTILGSTFHVQELLSSAMYLLETAVVIAVLAVIVILLFGD